MSERDVQNRRKKLIVLWVPAIVSMVVFSAVNVGAFTYGMSQ
jgi:hypothetical protein